jgi:hypothetical protein
MCDTEQLTLIGFASRLGTNVSFHALDGEDLQSNAQLLMSLMVSRDSPDRSENESIDFLTAQSDPNPVTSHVDLKESTIPFLFSCPSLSPDHVSSVNQPSTENALTLFELKSSILNENPRSTFQSPTNFLTLGRPLIVEDRDALRLSSEAMARNILRTFEKSIHWRRKCWIEMLTRSLVFKESEMRKAGCSEKDSKCLINSPEAIVITSLDKGKIEVLSARTSFRILPQRWNKEEGKPESFPRKRRKIVNYDNPKGEYSIAHTLSFQAVLNISSPAGYSQVTVEAPGVMEGKFIAASDGNPTLVGVAVEIDTRVLAAMIEKSSRIILRVSAKTIIERTPIVAQSHERHLQKDCHPKADLSLTTITSPLVKSSKAIVTDELKVSASEPSIVTPRSESKGTAYCDSDHELMENVYIPVSFDERVPRQKRSFLRMVSPPPGSSSSDESVDHEPLALSRKGMIPSLVSPPPSVHYTDGSKDEYISQISHSCPALPALLKVACAEMKNADRSNLVSRKKSYSFPNDGMQ